MYKIKNKTYVQNLNCLYDVILKNDVVFGKKLISPITTLVINLSSRD